MFERVNVNDKQSEILFELTINSKADENQTDEERHRETDSTEVNYVKNQIMIESLKIKQTRIIEGYTIPKIHNSLPKEECN